VEGKIANQWNISTQPDKRSNYVVHKVRRDGGEPGYALKMYRTDILTWWKKGDIDYEHYDSGITYDVMNEFGPLRVWRMGSNYKYHHRFRWGRPGWYFPNDGELPIGSFPFCQQYGRMTLPAKGIIKGLHDEYNRIDPAKKAERKRLLKTYRTNALPRIMLGEFGPRFAVHGSARTKGFGRKQNVEGWWSHLPSSFVHNSLFQLFSDNADHDTIEEVLNSSTRWTLHSPSESMEEAVRKAVDVIGRNALEHESWYETVRINHEPVRWTDYA
jgi:hypothetical protein